MPGLTDEMASRYRKLHNGLWAGLIAWFVGLFFLNEYLPDPDTEVTVIAAAAPVLVPIAEGLLSLVVIERKLMNGPAPDPELPLKGIITSGFPAPSERTGPLNTCSERQSGTSI
nr:hypothetical protein [uncultured bacterium]